MVYVCFRNEWYVAHARDAGRLEGRYRPELELQLREEARQRKSAANKDKVSAKNAKMRNQLWKPEIWDARIREQLSEMYYLYERLGMTEVMDEAINPAGSQVTLGLPKGTEMDLLSAIAREPKPPGPSEDVTDVEPPDDPVADTTVPSPASSPTPAPNGDVSAPKQRRKTVSTASAPSPSRPAPAPAQAPEESVDVVDEFGYF